MIASGFFFAKRYPQAIKAFRKSGVAAMVGLIVFSVFAFIFGLH